MQSQKGERGAALILLIGITAALAILAATLVMVLANQQAATASERTRKTAQNYAEGALDTAAAKAKASVSDDGTWPTAQNLLDAFKAGFPGGVLPAGMTAQFWIYDNSGTRLQYLTDANLDTMMWLEVLLTYRGKSVRMRVLIGTTTVSAIKAFPKAVVYSDSGIRLDGTSDVYAVESNGTTPYIPASHGGGYATTVMAGGGNSTASGARDFTANSSANLAAPTSSVQSVNIQVNGAVSPTGRFSGTLIGGVGLLSDYFDQAAQADLGDEAQAGEVAAAAPTAPSSWASSGTTMTSAVRNTLQDTSSTTAYTALTDLTVPTSLGDLTLSRGTNTTGRTFTFKKLYVAGNLTLTGPVTVIATSLYVGGTITINNATTTPVTDTLGPVYVAGASASSVSGRVTLNTSSFRTGGALTITNTTTTAVTDQLGPIYVLGALGVSGNVALYSPSTAPTSVYSGGAATITGPTSGSVTDQFALLYCAGTLDLKNNAQVRSTGVVVNGNFTISGATSQMTNQFGPIWASGTCAWSGTASVQSNYYTNAAADPACMYIGILNRSGTFNDIYGPTWCVGNAGTSTVAVRFTGPSSGTACTVKCPLLATTEKTVTTGRVDFGSLTKPMVYYMMCDNDSLYSNTCEWGSSGTFYGLMVVMEACLQITGGNGTTPCVIGAVFNGTPYLSVTSPSVNDITLTGASTVAYSQAVLDAIMNTSIRTTTTITQIVPGSWQQLPVN
jgi:hypothetical protein